MKFSILYLLCLPVIFCTLSNAQDAHEVRKWSSVDGSRTFEGKALKYNGKQVTISRTGQAPKVFPINLFSDNDKRWLEENKEKLQNSSSAEKKNATENLVGKQFGEMTYSMNAREGLNGAQSLSWGKKPIKNGAKYYIIFYSASWCPPCRKEMPNVVKLYNDSIASDPNIDLVLNSFDSNSKGMKEWAEKEKMSFPILPKDKLEKVPVAKELSPTGIPTAFLVEASTGKVLYRGLPSGSYHAYLNLKKGE